ncbi:MAG: 50S ribosomal protein L1 [Planctomycetota bacterium]
MYRSKRYKKLARVVSPEPMELQDAVRKIKMLATAKFPETVELAIKLDIDTKQATQQVRGSFSLPHGLGKTKRVIAFCNPEQVEEALAAGAIKAGLEDLTEEIMKGFMDFDVAVAIPDARRVIGKLGKILGARGLMPNPKSGTIGPDIAQLVREFTAGKVEYRNDSTGNIHVPVGKVDFPDEKLTENIKAMYLHILERRPAAVRGVYLRSAHICTTMSPAIKLRPISRD